MDDRAAAFTRWWNQDGLQATHRFPANSREFAYAVWVGATAPLERELAYAISKDHEMIAADRHIHLALGRAEGADALIAYLDGLFVSGNDVPVTRPWFSAETWDVVKDYVRHGLPLDHDRIEIERIYRQKTAAGLRAYSPLQDAIAQRTNAAL